MTIHIAPTASVHPDAQIDDEVEIGAFSVVGPDACIKSGSRLLNSVTIMGHVTIGHDNVIYPNVVIGGEPQDISYAGSDTQVVIGDGNTIREGVTINRGSEKEDGITRICADASPRIAFGRSPLAPIIVRRAPRAAGGRSDTRRRGR